MQEEKVVRSKSVSTRGRTLDHAAFIYDFCEPILMLGKQAVYDQSIVDLLELNPGDRVLDLGCGTGVLTRLIADRLDAGSGGMAIGIDAASKMIRVAQKKRQTENCRFEVVAAENLPYPDSTFQAVVSSLFFHHLPLDLKKRALQESWRVLTPKGKLVIADMHCPTTRMGALVSHLSRWFFLQPQIGENIQGVLPGLMEEAGFGQPVLVRMFFGYIALFASHKPGRPQP